MTNESIDAQIARFERIIKAATVMSKQEKVALAEWEKTNVTGSGDFGTSDWPGWEAIISRISH
ncbi:hypothetical protein BLL42_27585 (plasmid) [Pseudomonas frederiksbergensis]|uniref:Uncharacterized protein n=1 Tax=Pseudomonas frederiksbergensis TaxID=104087 RepID=A0A1J0ETM2_9PSED|nr:hypothetical protein [Pseudomonas frederiksbergensis]APC19498.1 hypothetical protein BLL42_27585 [Pseudomonas frederiksbergensis]